MKKKSSTLVLVGVCVALCAGTQAMAGPDGDAKVKQEAKKRERRAVVDKLVGADLKTVTLTGVLTKTETAGKDGKTRTQFTLTDENGTRTRVPMSHAKPGADAQATPDLNAFVDQTVCIVAKAREKEADGTKRTMLVRVESIKAVDGDNDMGGEEDVELLPEE